MKTYMMLHKNHMWRTHAGSKPRGCVRGAHGPADVSSEPRGAVLHGASTTGIAGTFQPTRHPLIAVQVMEDEGCVRAQDGRPLEAVITEKLRHPALVAALGHAAAPGPDARTGARRRGCCWNSATAAA